MADLRRCMWAVAGGLVILAGLACASQGSLRKAEVETAALREQVTTLSGELDQVKGALATTTQELANAKADLSATTGALRYLDDAVAQDLRDFRSDHVRFQRLISVSELTNILALSYSPEGFYATQDAMTLLLILMEDPELQLVWRGVAPLSYGAGLADPRAWDKFLAAIRQRLVEAQQQPLR